MKTNFLLVHKLNLSQIVTKTNFLLFCFSDGPQVLEEPEVRQEAQRQHQPAAEAGRQERRRIEINSQFLSSRCSFWQNK
jgi:hypothetical protein